MYAIRSYYVKKKKIKDYKGFPIQLVDKDRGFVRYLAGGLLFGLGWGLVGCCPGPVFILLGTGAFSIVIVLVGALLGTFLYGILKDKFVITSYSIHYTKLYEIDLVFVCSS